MNFVLPLLILSSSASSSVCFSMRSDSFHNNAWRSAGSMSCQGPVSKAARAAATARSTSAELASTTEAISRPVAGSTTEIRSCDLASTHSPPMNRRGGRFRNFATVADGSGCVAICDWEIEAFTVEDLRYGIDVSCNVALPHDNPALPMERLNSTQRERAGNPLAYGQVFRLTRTRSCPAIRGVRQCLSWKLFR